MLPNLRLMLVALFASMLGIVCGLGLFAAFRVNHDPFARMVSSGPRLQLSVDGPLVGGASDAAPNATPFGTRFAVNLPQAVAATAPAVLIDSGQFAPSAEDDSAASALDPASVAASAPPADKPDSNAAEAPSASLDAAPAPETASSPSVVAVMTPPADAAPDIKAKEPDTSPETKPDVKSDAAGARPSAPAAPRLRHAGSRRASLRLRPKSDRRRKLVLLRRRPQAPVSNGTATQNPVWPQTVQPTPEAAARAARRRTSGLQNSNGSPVGIFVGYDSTPR